jgi:hypothetical protein
MTWRENGRVAVLSADRQLRDDACAELRRRGAEPYVLSDPLDIRTMTTIDAVLFFADGFSAAAALASILAIERWVAGPVLVVITDKDPPLWRPTIKRDRLSVLLKRAEWSNVFTMPEGARDRSRPELPFTD